MNRSLATIGANGRDVAVILAILLAGLVFFGVRVTRGVDITDEAYFLTHAMEWLRRGFADSTNLNIQQLSGLVTFPFVRLWIAMSGGLDGIVLAMRWTYALFAIGAAITIYDFAGRLATRSVAALAGLLAIAFIPFGMPAPSYNTIAMFGSASALCLFGSGLLASRAGSPKAAYSRLALSAVLWVIVGISYQTLVLAPVVVLGLALLVLRDQRRLLMVYAMLVGACGLAGAVVLLSVFGLNRLLAMLSYTSGSAQLGDRFLWKVEFSLGRLAAEPLVAVSLATMAIAPLGLLRMKMSRSLLGLSALFAVCLICLMMGGPAAFLKSHDVMIHALIFSVWGVLILGRHCPERRVAGIVVVGGVACGLITTYTSLYSIFNLPVGSFVASAVGLALVAGRSIGWKGAVRVAPLVLCLVIVAPLSLQRVYGEVSGYMPPYAERIERGPFRGLWTSPDMKDYIRDVTESFAQHVRPDDTVTVFGQVAGLYLLTDGIPHGLSTWPMNSETGPSSRAEWDAFLRAQPPDAVAYYFDDWSEEFGSTETATLARYREVARRNQAFRHFVLALPASPTGADLSMDMRDSAGSSSARREAAGCPSSEARC